MSTLRSVLLAALLVAAVTGVPTGKPTDAPTGPTDAPTGPTDAPTGPTEEPPAAECDPELCVSPDCRCSSTETPGGLTPGEIPQLVVLTFDEAVTTSNIKFYEELSDRYKNPNDCRIGITFFVNHEFTDYTLVNRLHRLGHEIGTRSVSAEATINNYWEDLDSQGWLDEMEGMRDMLYLYGKIPKEDVKGFRVPYLEMQGDIMYKALKEANYTYDSSWTTVQYTQWYPNIDDALGTLWPYTLDYASVQDEQVGEAPTASVPGLWVNPITDLEDANSTQCAMLDACAGVDKLDKYGVYNLLMENFMQHYMSNRSPFGVYTREAFFRNGDEDNKGDIRQDGFEMFLDYLSNLPNVYVVTINQLIDWVKAPKSIEDIDEFFSCDEDLPEDNCLAVDNKNCPYKEGLPHGLESVYMKICQGECPPVYPWVGNVEGKADSDA